MSEDVTLDDFVEKEQESVDGFKETAAGRIPSDWNTENVEMLCELRNGKATNHADIGESEYFVYGSNGPIGSHSESNFDGGLIFGRVGAVGEVERVRQPVWVSDNAIQATVNKECNTDFLYYFLSNKELSSLATKTAQPLLNQSTIGNVAVPTPAISEQRKIATVLHNVDRAIQKTEEIIEQTRRVKTGLHQTLFRNWSGTTASDPLAGEYPEEWNLMEMSEVVEVTDAEHFTPDYTDTGIPVLRPGDLTPGRISLDNVEKRVDEETYEELTSRRVPSNEDIVYSRSQNFAIASQVIEDQKYCLGQDMVVIEPKNLNPTFLLHLLNSPVVKSQAIRRSTGSTFSRVNLGDIRSYKIPIPDEGVQEEIATRMSEVEERISVEEEYQEQLKRLKRGLMQDLLSGTVRTTDTNIEVPDEIAQHG